MYKLFLLVCIIYLVGEVQSQCVCPSTPTSVDDFSGLAMNTRTLIKSNIQAGNSFEITVPYPSNTVAFDTCGTTEDTYITVYKGSCSSLKAFNDDFNTCGLASKVTITPSTSVFTVVVNGVSCESATDSPPHPFGSTVNLYMTVTPSTTPSFPPNFEPFGTASGDSVLPRCDDCSTTSIALPFPLKYYQSYYPKIYINSNGAVSFNVAIYSVSSKPFPEVGEYLLTPLICPFWADTDTRLSTAGYVYYRVTTKSTPSIDAEVSDIFNITFSSDMQIIVTYDHVGYFNGQTDKLNTFQLAIYADSATNIAVSYFRYAPNGINWVTGSGGTAGFGGFPAKVGFDKGDGHSAFILPNSGTNNVQYIDDGSNIDLLGSYLYRIDNKTVIDPSACVPKITCTSNHLTYNVGDQPDWTALDNNSFICPETNVWVSPSTITCDMYPSTTLTFHLDYFNCPVDVTVNDPVPPVFPDCSSSVITIITDNVTCDRTYAPTVTDNCGIKVYPDPKYLPLGASSQTYSTTDIGGNTVSCNYNFNVVDQVPPVAKCRNIDVNLDPTGKTSITAVEIDNNSIDNCGVATRSASPANFTCNNLGANAVTLSVTDIYGNVGTCVSSVNVIDGIPPVAKCKTGVTVNITGGSATIPTSFLDNNSTDNCNVKTLAAIPPTITCSNTKTPLSVTLKATDTSNNQHTCITDVLAIDITPPTAICKDIVKRFQGGAESLTVFPSDINNGSYDNCAIDNLAISGNSNLVKGGIGGPIVLQVTDVNGLVSKCTSFVTTPIGRDDYLIVPTNITMLIPFEIDWPDSSDFNDKDLVSFRAIDTSTLFEVPIAHNIPFNSYSYISDGLFDTTPNRNYLIVMTKQSTNLDYASSPAYLSEFPPNVNY